MKHMNLDLDKRLIQIRPSDRQIKYQEMEYFCFVHFSVNTYTGKEWGTGTESPAIFDPVKMDAEQWVKAAKAGGMKGLLLTCKHHDGFCLWPSKYTEHSIKHSPYKEGKGDIVREVSDACKKYGLKFGVYLSPWDRNCKLYGEGTPYNDYYVRQLTELLSEYGDIYVVWLDGACGEGANGKFQEYDWDRYFEVVRRLQPEANIFGCGPDVRWCGNEAGETRPSEWSVVPADMANAEKVSALSQHEDNAKFRERGIESTQMDLGSREKLKNEMDLIYYPAETNFSIRPGWFYHEEEDEKQRSVESLKDIYIKSVGGNTTMLLNIPPTREGLFHQNDVKVLAQLGEFVQTAFSNNLADQAQIETVPASDVRGNHGEVLRQESYDTYFENPEGEQELTVELNWKESKELHYLVMKEQIELSQRIESFIVSYEKADGEIETLYQGTVVGHKRIVELMGIRTKRLLIHITDARVAPVLTFAGVY